MVILGINLNFYFFPPIEVAGMIEISTRAEAHPAEGMEAGT